ncbi:glycosyltransferase family 4 protein [Hymenobacter psoromatis]|uniref:glycosyltransferase family 4 protein n=1 Tax=Hymenobacter psoromatis TaxID=1484116 RepID=UPI001CBED12E|nr:glycosyltransferase family 4 protein [Hymenobacter psoromatis]
MSSPTAASALPLAVLVLAWDETTPAVRALIAATQASAPALASILVMVPKAEPSGTLSAEEYLPLPPATVATAPELPAALPAAAPEPVLVAGAPQMPPVAAGMHLAPPLPPLPAATLSKPWAAVRVLRLSSHPLPELARRAGQLLPAPAWAGPPAAPAAPYQGATPSPTRKAATRLPALGSPLPVPAAPAKGAAKDALLPVYEPTEPLALAPDAEADWPATTVADELRQFELAAASPAQAELPASPEPAGWPEALAALGQPVALSEAGLPTPSPPAGALRAASLYDAPNLNFQVIQYARFAVPVALAEAPYAVIYAPAWPTWLAAQELRQRTGQPLVLHVATLAALTGDSLETATGWEAELQRQALRRADVILTETPALAQRLCHELNLPGTRVHTVPAADTQAIALALQAARPRPVAEPA